MLGKNKAKIAVLAAALGLLVGGAAFVLHRRLNPLLPTDVAALLRDATAYDGPNKPDRMVRASVEVGRAVGMDLRRLVRVSRRVPAYYRPDFYDGAAHGIPWPVDDLAGCFRAIETSVPERYQRYLYLGPIARLVRVHGGDPAEVLPRLNNLPAPMRPHIANGLRIGLLLECLPDWNRAIAAIVQYPEEYRGTMFEEFGWWMGEDLKTDTGQVLGLLAQVPEPYRVAACQGYIRGLNLSDDRPAYEAVINRLGPDYRDAATEALNRKFQAWAEDRRNE